MEQEHDKIIFVARLPRIFQTESEITDHFLLK